MSTTCKGVCYRYKAKTSPTKKRYDSGQKFCSICKIFFEQKSNRCVCCMTKLRTRARTSISRQNVINRSGGI